MKKVILFLSIVFALINSKSEAQIINCNASFATQYLSSNTVKFNPIMLNDTPLVHHNWDFGDLTPNSTQVSPTHIYNNAGVFSVKHYVYITPNSGIPLCGDTITQVITIGQNVCTNLQAAFTPITSSGLSPLVQYFSNTSTGVAPTDSIRWTFGDGTSASTYHTNHTYANFGTYNVCLRIIKRNPNGVLIPNCVSEVCTTITIIAPPPVCMANTSFAIFPSSTSISILDQNFVNATFNINTTDSMRWSFGDGTFANTYNATHSYANYGTYNVCFRVIRRINGVLDLTCIRETCQVNTIVNPNPSCALQSAFNVVTSPGSTNPLVKYFSNTSIGAAPTDSIRWTFGDGTSASTFNANHTYANFGTYNVCLRIIKRNPNGVLIPNCVSEFCYAINLVNPVPCQMQAFFSDSLTSPLTHHFNNGSVGVISTDIYSWNFGDAASGANNFSTLFNPNHVFSSSGTYNVCLTIVRPSITTMPACTTQYCKNVVISTQNTCTLNSNFNINAVASSPYVRVFNNISVGAAPTDSIRWSFGDGTFASTYNATHTYTNAGPYFVCLRIIKRNPNGVLLTNCVSEYCRVDSIITPILPCNLQANFAFGATSPNALTQYFTNTSIGAAPTDSIRWSFGDGTFANTYNATHNYVNAGVYNVCLRIIKRNPNGVLLTSCVSEKCRLDTITLPYNCNFQAYFSTTTTSTTSPSTVQFINQTPGLVSSDIITWTFGDGSSSTGATTSHTYSNPGTYIACLTILRQSTAGLPSCTKQYCKAIQVIAPSVICNILPNFIWYRDSVATTNLYHFTNTTTNLSATDSIRWSFGDGTFSNALNPNHVYAQYGQYNVCLRIIKRNANGTLSNCIREKCYSVVVYPNTTINCNNVTLSFNTTTDPLYQNRKRFTAFSTNQIYNQRWTITKLPITASSSTVILNQFNPTYVFMDTGTYRVCLRATFANNCIKEYCTTVYIANVIPTTNICNLQLFPNPATNVVTGSITLAQPLVLYAFVFNSQNMLVAQKIQQGAIGTNLVTVNIGNLPAGVYRYRLFYGFQNCTSTFVKQ